MNPFNMRVSKDMKVYRPNDKFWKQWRANKQYLKEDGVRVIKIENKYIVLVPVNFKEEEELPKIELTSVQFHKTNTTIDRENDLIYQAVVRTTQEIKNLQAECNKNGTLCHHFLSFSN